ncbi:hypothetical protein SMD44_08632 [Streptomyces alboflavus]|uniref:Uncharacterized protein n=1 Tax=Streptomyces alboflavus TaxID=67267 RepID=A0A1Z1WRU2_9ACTN|nr:hypothetical protein SMD44_08632 [Streptomyces alboflavus]
MQPSAGRTRRAASSLNLAPPTSRTSRLVRFVGRGRGGLRPHQRERGHEAGEGDALALDQREGGLGRGLRAEHDAGTGVERAEGSREDSGKLWAAGSAHR